jgi:hypothetical protein
VVGWLSLENSFETGPVWRVDLGLERGRVKKKIEKEKTWCDPVDLAG